MRMGMHAQCHPACCSSFPESLQHSSRHQPVQKHTLTAPQRTQPASWPTLVYCLARRVGRKKPLTMVSASRPPSSLSLRKPPGVR